MTVEIEIVALSKQGGRSYNEDVHGHWHNEEFIACLVADGAGGHGGGDVAAGIARSTILKGFAAQPEITREFLRNLLLQANKAVVAHQGDDAKLASMRTTIVLAVIDLHRHELVWAHCGDSRAYIFRASKVLNRTSDHSLVQQLVASGMINDEGARVHPQRNLLLSALGSVETEPDIAISEPMKIVAGDVLLLCSDGVWEPLGDAMLEQTLLTSPSPRIWLQNVDESVQACAKPGHDNYTALTLWTYSENVVTQMDTLAE
jgi:PPM family protein phosphatase